jgi:urease accessory protein
MAEGWHALLELGFEQNRSVTRLMRRRHEGPLAVQRAFYPESDGSAHVYLLHPPGGVAGGDQLNVRCCLGPEARTVLTTPGATKFYRSNQGRSSLKTEIDIAAGGVCEYLPQETILFDGADASVHTTIRLAADAVYLGWEFVSFGRPACGETFTTGHVHQRTEIVRDGRCIWFEQLRISGGDPLNGAAFGLAGQPVLGTMIYAGPMPEEAIDRVRASLDAQALSRVSISQLERVVVCRYLGGRMSEAKKLFRQVWEILREAGLNKAAAAPRIWAT